MSDAGGRMTVREGSIGVLISAPTLDALTPRLVAAVEDDSCGATGVVRQVIDGLLGLAGQRDRLRIAADLLAARLPWCAPMWHVVRAAYARRPALALRSLRRRLEVDVGCSVAAAVALVAGRGCAVRAVPGSGLVAAVLDALAGRVTAGGVVGLAGADALGPGVVLNVVGTRAVARAVPTIVVATSVKLVPQEAFRRLGAPGFERVPLRMFEAVVLDGEVLTPAQAGRRALTLG